MGEVVHSHRTVRLVTAKVVSCVMGPKAKTSPSKGKQAEKLPQVSPKGSPPQQNKDGKKGGAGEKVSLPAVDGAVSPVERPLKRSSKNDSAIDGSAVLPVPEDMVDILCSMIAFTVASEFM